MRHALFFAFSVLAGWQMSQHTEVISVEHRKFSQFEFGVWLAAFLAFAFIAFTVFKRRVTFAGLTVLAPFGAAMAYYMSIFTDIEVCLATAGHSLLSPRAPAQQPHESHVTTARRGDNS